MAFTLTKLSVYFILVYLSQAFLFLRSYRYALYRMLLWFIYSKWGRYIRKIIPVCATIKFQERFPEKNGIYRDLKDDNNEEGISEIVEAWEYICAVEEEQFLFFNENIYILCSMV